MTGIKKRIAQYQYEDKIRGLYTTIVGNLLLFLVLMLPDFDNILQRPHALICLATAVIFFTFKKSYDWKVNLTNILLVVFYLGLVVYEYFQYGLPYGPLHYRYENYQMSKGFMFDLLVWALPLIYLGIRILLVVPLVRMINLKVAGNNGG